MPVVLVTGASRGIGRATALRLAGEGYDVFAGVRSAEAGESISSASSGKVTALRLDITSEADVAGLDAALPERLDAVVNNAGIVVGGPVEAVAIDALRRQLEVNVIGQIAVTQVLLPRLRSSKGRILFVSSVSGRISSPMVGPYSASKFALEALADALRVELRPWAIEVILVEPAQTDTDMWRGAGEMLEETVAEMSPSDRQLYGAHIEGQRRSIPKSQKAATAPDAVASTIAAALRAARPRARYVVGAVPKLAASAFSLLPTSVTDRLLAKSSGIPARP